MNDRSDKLSGAGIRFRLMGRISELEKALLIAIEHLDPDPVANELRAVLAPPKAKT